MRKNASNVTAAWLFGRDANEKTLRTDGHTVWSYSMPIAHRFQSLNRAFTPIVIAQSHAPTHTTASHLKACIDAAQVGGYVIIRVSDVAHASSRLKALLQDDSEALRAADAALRLGNADPLVALLEEQTR